VVEVESFRSKRRAGRRPVQRGLDPRPGHGDRAVAVHDQNHGEQILMKNATCILIGSGQVMAHRRTSSFKLRGDARPCLV